MNDIVREFRERKREERNKVIETLTEEQKQFCDNLAHAYTYNRDGYYQKKILAGMNDGTYHTPSDFIEVELGWMFPRLIPERFKEALKYTLDHSREWAYSDSRWRRSFRTKVYYVENMVELIAEFYKQDYYDADICDVLTLNLPEDACCNIREEQSAWSRISGMTEYQIAYELDKGNPRLEEILTDIINGDGEIPVNYSIIGGIVKSNNARMHEQLGKLLLAARLQEGLRQAICEQMDLGTTSAFFYLLKIIAEHNLIRFSSVKRAVGTWLGLLSSEENDLERISAKSMTLIQEAILDEKVIEEYLQSEDCMKIHIGLWATAVHETKNAVARVKTILEQGTHHQVLTAGYFTENLEDVMFQHEVAKEVVCRYEQEYDILAVYMSYFLPSFRIRPGEYEKEKLETYFKNKEEAEKVYHILVQIYQAIPKKSLDFSPCIFPWYSASLKKTKIIYCMCRIAKMLEDSEKLDFCVKLVKECEGYERGRCIERVFGKPSSALQKEVVTALLCDRDGWTRDKAKDVVSKMKIEPENYLQMEEMLRYKSADMRETLIEFLCMQEEKALLATVERLLSDKKEEKRTAGLDIVMQIRKKEKSEELYEACVKLVEKIQNPTSKEELLIDNILGKQNGLMADGSFEQLEYKEEDAYIPEVVLTDYVKESIETFMEIFPESKLKEQVYEGEKSTGIFQKLKEAVSSKQQKFVNEIIKDCDALEAVLKEHIRDEFPSYGGNMNTMGCAIHCFTAIKDGKEELPLLEVWMEWYEQQIRSEKRLLRMMVLLREYKKDSTFVKAAKTPLEILLGGRIAPNREYEFHDKMRLITERLVKKYVGGELRRKIGVALAYWYVKCLPVENVILPLDVSEHGHVRAAEAHFITHDQIAYLFSMIDCDKKNDFSVMFPFVVAVEQKTFYRKIKEVTPINSYVPKLAPHSLVRPHKYMYYTGVRRYFDGADVKDYLFAAYREMISRKALYHFLLLPENQGDTFRVLSTMIMAIREKGKKMAKRGYTSIWETRMLVSIFNDFREMDGEEESLYAFVEEIYQAVISHVLSIELRRGDTETEFSDRIKNIKRIYGVNSFTAILTALGKDTLERSTYFSSETKKGTLSHLLSVCVPDEGDSAEKLRELVEKTDIAESRIIEAALYAPEWISIVGTYLGWEGFEQACYYFMAHMNESFDDVRKAMIAKYTPLTDDKLNRGAFDVNWFKQAYHTLGQKRFQEIYKAAKYISDGSKHSRARKYADAVLGKMDKKETEQKISDKRNKDFVMAYTLIPLQDEADVSERYLFLQQFLKESKKFGAQRIASEKQAVEIAMSNLAMNAGYADTIRLTFRMEAKLVEDKKELFQKKELEDAVVCLQVGEDGTTDICCEKNGKLLKSIPAKLKKDEYILALKEAKKVFAEQHRRAKIMFEQSMEDEVQFEVSEITLLNQNPVIAPVVKPLLYKCGEKIGFIEDGKLVDYEGNETSLQDSDTVIVAHPYHIYKDGHWSAYQQLLFEKRVKQPFKQVFRELYVKTEEELGMNYSRRYSGNQIQPRKTVACLKNRRWVADVEDGLQKVYYKENIVAKIYALADWFSPADIEAPTLEWVEFSERKTGKQIKISEIPEVIFSEVMRDVDLAVSVAHVGGVDPETSHSTIEMRAALLNFTLPLFGLSNVTIEKNHAFVEGHYGTYTVHLGSGVIHKQGGAMIHVLPVHSQHRGKLFLPFVDDDPKTAEVLTKVILFAEDKKIQDPSITAQIMR